MRIKLVSGIVAVMLAACQSSLVPPDEVSSPPLQQQPACDHVILAGEFETLGELAFTPGMTVVDAYTAGKRTFHFRAIWVERDGRQIETFRPGRQNDLSSEFELMPCDVIRGVGGPF